MLHLRSFLILPNVAPARFVTTNSCSNALPTNSISPRTSYRNLSHFWRSFNNDLWSYNPQGVTTMLTTKQSNKELTRVYNQTLYDNCPSFEGFPAPTTVQNSGNYRIVSDCK